MSSLNLNNGSRKGNGDIIPEFKRESVAASIANFLRDAMISGYYKPADKLKEKDICEELNVSRTPLREAFRILQSEGLLTYSSHQGVMVTPVSLEDIDNLWEVRYALEVMATEKAVDNMTSQDISILEEIQREMEALKPTDKIDIIRINSKLHMNIVKAANNDRLEKIIKDIWTQIQVIQSISFVKGGRFEETCAEHRQILSAIISKDKELVGKYMREHLSKGKEALLSGMRI